MLSFAPDALDIAPEALQAISGVPTLRGYKTAPAGVDMGGDQFSGTSTGGATLFGLSGTSRTFVGTGAILYEYAAGSWTDRSRAGAPAYSSGSARWRFAQFGDTELAINKSTQLQSSTTAAFADVANAPKAACMEVVAGFVMLADCDDTSTGLSTGFGDQSHRWWCSQIFNATGTWAPSAATQATSGLLIETPGAIKQLKRLNNDCIAYKPRSVYVGRYVGGAAVWQWQCIATDTGTEAPESVVSVGSRHFFIGDSDVYSFDGQTVQPIGALIKDWFFARVNRSWLSAIQSLHDRTAKLIYWFYPSGSDDTLNSVLVYHYDSQRWGAFDLTVADVIETITGTVTYDDLGTSYSTYDDMPNIPYDSPFWNANSPVLAYLSSTNYLTSLTGAAASLTMTTGYYGDEGVVSLCTRVRPRMRTAPTSATINGYTVMTLSDAPTLAVNGSTLQAGRFDVLQAGRYHRFAATFNGSCEVEALVPTLTQQGLE